MLVENNNDLRINNLTKYNNFLNKCQQSYIYEETLETFM